MESMICIILLCLIFFGTMQVFHYAMSKMVEQYAAFNGAKAWTLGYTPRITAKTVRISSMGISGKDYSSPKMRGLSRESLYHQMQLYMTSGTAGVDFEYWDNQGGIGCATCGNMGQKTRLRHSISSEYGPEVTIQVRLEHAPVLADGVAGLLRMGFDDATIRTNYKFYNHSHKYLQNNLLE